MATQGRNMNPEDEYFARRAGEIERERDRREAAETSLEDGNASPLERDDTKPSSGGRASKLVGAMRAAVKALFAIRRTRRPA